MQLIGDMGGFPRPGVPVIVNPRTGFPFGLFPVRQDLTAAGGETHITLAVPVYGDSLMLFKDGVLLTSAQYTRNSARDVELTTPATNGHIYTVACLSTTQSRKVGVFIPVANDPDFAFRVSLLHFLGADHSTTYADEIGGRVWTPGNGSEIRTSWGAVGQGSSGAFGSTNQYISTPDTSDLRIGTQDFLIQFWLNWINLGSGYETVASKGYVSAGDWAIQTNGGTGKLIWYGSGTPIATESAGTMFDGTPYFHQIYRTGGTLYIERDGSIVASGADTTNYNGTDLLGIGARSSGGGFAGNELHAYMGEFRFAIGISGTPGFVQSSPYPNS